MQNRNSNKNFLCKILDGDYVVVGFNQNDKYFGTFSVVLNIWSFKVCGVCSSADFYKTSHVLGCKLRL